MKKLMKVLPVMMLVCLAFTSVFAINMNLNNLTQSQSGATTITQAAITITTQMKNISL